MKKILVIYLSLFLCACIFAENKNKFKEANEFYAQSDFYDAARLYEEILQEEGVAPELYYNLGNSYLKTEEIGRAILNYERALRLKPNFEDAKYNLAFAREKLLDDIHEPNVFFLKKHMQILTKLCSSNQWLYLSSTLFLFALIALLLFVFARNIKSRKISFVFAFNLLIISAVSLCFSIEERNHAQSLNEAIIMQGVISVKSSPNQASTDLFELHEGTKVNIKNSLNDWIEIQISDERVGWVKESQVEKI